MMPTGQTGTMRPYSLGQWKDGVHPPKGWDCADAIEDGWTREDVTWFLKKTVRDTLPAWPDELATGKTEPAGPPEPEPEEDPGDVESDGPTHPPAPMQPPGGAQLSKLVDIEHASEVFLAEGLAAQLRAAHAGNVVYTDGAFWRWGPTDWNEIPEQELRLAVHRFDGATVQGKSPIKIGKRMIDGVISETGTILGKRGFFDEPVVGLNCENVVIEVDGKGAVRTRPHSPDDRFRFTIPAEFTLNTDMRPPKGSMLHTLLEGAFRGDPDAAGKFDLIGEILGAAAFGMATRLPQPKAFVFLGETASNGKSTVASLLRCLLPKSAVSSIPPSAYEDERRIINLAGKAANVADELSVSAISGETFKAAVTGDPIEGRDLYRSAMTFVPQALHLFTTNALPRFNGGLDRGLQRRLVVVTFNRTIPESEIIPDIADRIKRDELDLLLGMAISGAQRLISRRGYTIPASSSDALSSWLRLDPINEWFEERCVEIETEPMDGWMRTSELFKDFKTWAVDHGHAERFLPAVTIFGQRFKLLPGVVITRRAKGSVAIGIGLADGQGERARQRDDW